jgi:long-chain acyl-CoA synthetase
MLYEAWCNKELDFLREDDVQLLFLPLAHSYAKVIEIGWLSTGHVMGFAESMNTIKDNLGEVRPTVMCGVPRIYEKFYAAVVEKGLASSGLKRRLFGAALELSRRNGEAELRGETFGALDALKLAVLKRLVFSKIGERVREVLGGRMRCLISGGAPLPRTVAWFMRDAGIEIAEGYGLTETSAATCVNRPGSIKIGTVGPPVPNTEVRTAEDGEILIKGQGVMREYWKEPDATAAVLRDGWFYTGDIGKVDSEGHVWITDRKKDIIVTAGGKNITPQNIENMIKAHELVSHALVHGDRRKYLTALITVDADALEKLAKRRRLEDGGYSALCRRPEVLEAIQAVVDECNSRLRSVETIKRFKVLEEDFSQEGGELTPKLSVKRKVVYDKYREILDGLYDDHMLA